MAHIDPDADLLPGLRAGQSAALAAMMDRHLGKIHALGYYMLGDRSLAEDVAQDSFLKLWQAAPNWREGEARMLTWLRRVATNNCLDQLRKKGPIYTDDVPEVSDTSPSADASVAQSDTAGLVRDALNSLPNTQRAAISLSYYQEVSQKEGAAILGVSEKAYESLLSRGRRGLKDRLMTLREQDVI
ncbi:sigma-70 family RNA polymerase sigma factor [Litorimonas sp. RW-G-Af-16]|uniref:sigma-70 family RNA polymerase sigma factor n=1 Tax=Litorimonas sp. RW-G-Af-16 TaxID=3241168 RepID=UPI00390C483B